VYMGASCESALSYVKNEFKIGENIPILLIITCGRGQQSKERRGGIKRGKLPYTERVLVICNHVISRRGQNRHMRSYRIEIE
jgi:hypothetical protein